MFSERYRFLKLSLLCAILLTLCIYSYQTASSGGLHQKQADKAAEYEGRIPVKFGFATVEKVFDDGRIGLAWGNNRYQIETNAKDIKPGQAISVSGYLHKDGRLIVEHMVVHRYRWIKKVISIVVTLFILLLGVTRFRVSWKDRVILERA